MPASVVKEMRDKIKSISFDIQREDGSTATLHPILSCISANGTDRIYDKNDGCVKWDDDKEVVYSFLFNNNSHTNVMSMSRGGKVIAPVKFQVVAYEDITRLESVFNWEMAQQMATSLNMSVDEIRNLYERRFRAADIDWHVKHDERLGYSNLHSQKYNSGLQHSDLDEYTETVHPAQY